MKFDFHTSSLLFLKCEVILIELLLFLLGSLQRLDLATWCSKSIDAPYMIADA